MVIVFHDVESSDKVGPRYFHVALGLQAVKLLRKKWKHKSAFLFQLLQEGGELFPQSQGMHCVFLLPALQPHAFHIYFLYKIVQIVQISRIRSDVRNCI